MSKGGWGIFQVPMDYNSESTAREMVFGQKDHVRKYGRDYIERLKSDGFDVIEEDYVRSFSSIKIYKYGLQDLN